MGLWIPAIALSIAFFCKNHVFGRLLGTIMEPENGKGVEADS
jgi:hypothetical protein